MQITRRAFTRASLGAGVLAATGGSLHAQEALIMRRMPNAAPPAGGVLRRTLTA